MGLRLAAVGYLGATLGCAFLSSSSGRTVTTGCTADSDCNGGRICAGGSCVDRVTEAGAGGAGAALGELGAHCLINTDCAAPLVCAFGACHTTCQTSRDCSTDQTCVVSGAP